MDEGSAAVSASDKFGLSCASTQRRMVVVTTSLSLRRGACSTHRSFSSNQIFGHKLMSPSSKQFIGVRVALAHMIQNDFPEL